MPCDTKGSVCLHTFKFQLIILIASLSIKYFNVTIRVLKFLRSQKVKNFCNSAHTIANLVLIQILFSCPDWFEWLQDWKIADGAKFTKNIIQLSYVAIVSGYNHWISNYHIYGPKPGLKKAVYKQAGYTSTAYDINNFSISLVFGLLIPFAFFILVAIFLFWVKQYNLSKGCSFFITPKDTTPKLMLKSQNENYRINDMSYPEEHYLYKIKRCFHKN